MDLRSYLELFLFDPQKQRQKVGALSGGERARVALAKVLKTGANLLMFDEPTNDLDLPTLGALEEMLVSWPGTVLVVTHDRAFLDRVATSILAFERDDKTGRAKVEQHGGGYEDYVAHVREREGRERRAETERTARAEVAASKSEASKGRVKSTLTYAERIELDGLLERVDAAETRAKAAEAKLADPALYAHGGDVASLQAALAAAQAEVATLTARWEALEKKRGS